MDTQAKAATRAKKTWISSDSGSLDVFKTQLDRVTDPADWPNAARVESNVLIFDGNAIRRFLQVEEDERLVRAEWTAALSDGPGIIVIKGAFADTAVLDHATELFQSMIEDQRASAIGGGDHFAKPGANDRIWNALQKHCLADPANFAAYFGNPVIDLVSRAWLGDGYQMTAQVNRVNPGGAAQTAHRDYHLGFMANERMAHFPAHVHQVSPMLTLQGAIAHCDMPLESGPTLYLPYSHQFAEGYLAFERPDFQAFFDEHHVQLPLEKGDAVFFNPALMHAAGSNTSKDIYRLANLLQVSSAFGRAMETLDRTAMCEALYPELLAAKEGGGLTSAQLSAAISACADGYAFPTNLDSDPPIGGMAPATQADLMREALAEELSESDFTTKLRQQQDRRAP